MVESTEAIVQDTDLLTGIAKRLEDEATRGLKPGPAVLTVRTLLRSYGYERRARFVVGLIRNKLEELGLETDPDFEYWYIDGELSITKITTQGTAETWHRSDPTVRIGVLEAANRKPTSVKPDEDLSVATTKMQMNDFSQLPVMSGERSLKGIVSWESIGRRITLGQHCTLVKDCMDEAEQIGIDAPLLDAAEGIAKHG